MIWSVICAVSVFANASAFASSPLGALVTGPVVSMMVGPNSASEVNALLTKSNAAIRQVPMKFFLIFILYILL